MSVSEIEIDSTNGARRDFAPNPWPGRVLVGGAFVACSSAVPLMVGLIRSGMPTPFGFLFYAATTAITGTILSAVAYLTTWITLGPEKFRVRCFAVWGSLFIGIACFVTGAATDSGPADITHLLTAAGFVVWLALCLQGPLWAMRYFVGRRLTHPAGGERADRWSIRDWAIGAAIAGGALSAARTILGAPEGPIAVVAGMTYLLIFQLVQLPPVFYVLSNRPSDKAHRAFLIHLLVLQSPWAVVYYFKGLPRATIGAFVLYVTVITFGNYAAMWALRLGGYQLIRDGSAKPTTPAAPASPRPASE